MLRRTIRISAALICAAGAADCALGTVRVTGSFGASIDSSNFSVTQLQDGRWKVELLGLVGVSDGRFEVRADASDHIALIDNQIGNNNLVRLRVIPDFSGSGVGAVDEISSSVIGADLFVERVENGGDIGLIDARAIGEIISTGGLTTTSALTATGANPDAGNEDFGILDVEFVGAIRGSIESEAGSIRTVIASSVGTTGDHAEILARDGIDQVLVTGDVFATIDAKAFFGAGDLAVFEAASFDGVMRMRRFGTLPVAPGEAEGRIKVAGDLAGDIIIDESFDGGLSGSGTDLESRIIETGAGGLKGQVVVNAADNAFGWAGGEVKVGSSVTLTDPEYTVTAATLGGGAVGLAPYRLHDESCYPANNSVIPDSAGLQFIWVQHYGPIEISGGAFPVRISKRLAASQDPFVEISNPGFLFDVGVDGTDGKRLRITEKTTGAFADGYTYKIEPLSNLRSSLVAGTPSVSDYDYFVTISSSACPFEPCLCSTDPNCGLGLLASGPDFDQDGWVNDADLDLMMKATGVPGGRADLNMDQMVDSKDIAILMTHWGKYEPK